jgi:putative SOS response-associated peptidase YedK
MAFMNGKRTGKLKQPYFFQMKDEAPFTFAGIWEVAKGWRLYDFVRDHHHHSERTVSDDS